MMHTERHVFRILLCKMNFCDISRLQALIVPVDCVFVNNSDHENAKSFI